MRRLLLFCSLLIAACKGASPGPCETASDCPEGFICRVPAHACEAIVDHFDGLPAADLYEEPADLRQVPRDLSAACEGDLGCAAGKVCCKGQCSALADADNCGGCGVKCTAPAALCCPRRDMGHACTDILVGC